MEKNPGIDTDSIGLRNVGLLVSVFGPPFDGCPLCSEIRARIRVDQCSAVAMCLSDCVLPDTLGVRPPSSGVVSFSASRRSQSRPVCSEPHAVPSFASKAAGQKMGSVTAQKRWARPYDG